MNYKKRKKYAVCDNINLKNIVSFGEVPLVGNFPKQDELSNIIIANNSFAHIPEIKSVLKGVHSSLKDDGVFIFEVHYLNSLIELNQWDKYIS